MVKAKNRGKSVQEVIQTNTGDITAQKLAPRSDWSQMSESEHFVQFYETDLFLLDSLSGFIAAGLGAGDACIVVATKAHREGLEERLKSYGLDVDAADACGQYISLDAAETLSKFMVEGSPEPERFAEVLGGIIAQASDAGRRARVFGEMVSLLWEEGNQAAAIRVEELWNDLRKTHSFSLFCAYPMNGFEGEAFAESLSDVCREHSSVIPAESYTALDSPEDRLRAIMRLQQKARSLGTEIAERKEAEARLRVSEISYLRLFEATSDGILIVDPDTRKITDANPSVTKLLGTTREELLGKELWEIGLFKNRKANLEAFRQLREKHFIRYEHLLPRTKDGQPRHLELVGNLYPVNGHQVIQCNLRDITERKRAEEISSHLAAIVESSDDAIISKSLEGAILSWNKGAERIFGYSAEEAIGKPIHILIPPDRIGEEPDILEKLKRGEHVDHFETVRVTKDGRSVDVSLTVSPIKNRRGEIIAASKIARDITERKRAESERERLLTGEQAARAEAETANRAKDEFLAVLSHELRTPLNAILGWARMLRTGKFDEATAARALETIERNAKSQAQLIEDLLDISRIITGKLRLDVRPVELTKVIADAIDVVRPAADAKGIGLQVDLDPTACPILGDPARLQQTLWNLLSNAVKFTSNGGSVQVRLERVDSHIEISVSDTGRGINSEFLPFVFERFRQADSTLTRAQGGLGLGLAIVRHLVELHGGTVHAYSRGEGQGATFTLRLPLLAHRELEQHSPSSKAERDQTFGYSSVLENLRVLVVDDDADTREMLTAMLEQHGAQVTAVGSAAEALEAFEKLNPNVLVSDIEMPGEDGYSLIRKVRAKEAKRQEWIPSVALTAHARVEDRLRALSAGYQSHIAKPIEPAELIAVIDSLAGADRKIQHR